MRRGARGECIYDSIEKYLAFFDIGLKDWLTFKWDLLTAAIFRLMTPLVMLAVWSAIYAGSQSSELGGFTLTQTYSYFFAASLMSLLIDSDVHQRMQSDVVSGALSVNMTKPVIYLLGIIASDLPGQLLMAVIAGIPFSLVILPLLHLTIPLQNLAMFAVEIAVGYFVMYAIAVFLGMISFYLTNAGGIFNIAWMLIFFLGGGAMPLNFFPSGFSAILHYLPFQMLIYTPAETLLGLMSISQAAESTGIALVWCAGIVLFDYFFWKRSIKILAVAGG
jgi:ABC-2 type transport system permease protein